jgi:hypothetical protein
MRGPALTLPAALSLPPEPVCPQPPRAPEPRGRSPRARLRARAPRICGAAARRRDAAMLHPYGRDEPFRERWLPAPMHCRALPTRPEREVLSPVAQPPSRAFWLFLHDPVGCRRLSPPSARDLRAHGLDRLRARGHVLDLPALPLVPDDHDSHSRAQTSRMIPTRAWSVKPAGSGATGRERRRTSSPPARTSGTLAQCRDRAP